MTESTLAQTLSFFTVDPSRRVLLHQLPTVEQLSMWWGLGGLDLKTISSRLLMSEKKVQEAQERGFARLHFLDYLRAYRFARVRQDISPWLSDRDTAIMLLFFIKQNLAEAARKLNLNVNRAHYRTQWCIAHLRNSGCQTYKVFEYLYKFAPVMLKSTLYTTPTQDQMYLKYLQQESFVWTMNIVHCKTL